MEFQRENYYIIEDNENYVAFNSETLGIYRVNLKDIEDSLCKIKERYKEVPLEPSNIPPVLNQLKTLVICSSEECNLACEYCFANKGNYHNNKQERIVQFTEYKRLFKKVYMEFHEGIDAINFFGGEPLLGFQEIKKAIEWLEEYCVEKKIRTPIYSIISNGTIMSEEIYEFINKHNIYLTISLDANEIIHNKYRKYKNGLGSYEVIQKNLMMIKKYSKREFLLTCESTIGWEFLKNYESGNMKDYMKGFYELGIDSVATFLVDSDEKLTYDMKKKIEEFYSDLVDYTFELILNCDDYRKVSPFVLEQIVNMVLRRRKRECRAGKTTLFYTSGGEVFPCQMFYQADQNYMGNLYKDNVKEKMRELVKISRLDINKCYSCIAKNTCQQWCEGSSLLHNGYGRSTIDTRCTLQKAMTKQIIKNLSRVYYEPAMKNKFVKNMKMLAKRYSYQEMINANIF